MQLHFFKKSLFYVGSDQNECKAELIALKGKSKGHWGLTISFSIFSVSAFIRGYHLTLSSSG